MSMFASPTAVFSYTMSQQIGGDADLAGQIVIFSAVLSMITLFLWISSLILLELRLFRYFQPI